MKFRLRTPITALIAGLCTLGAGSLAALEGSEHPSTDLGGSKTIAVTNQGLWQSSVGGDYNNNNNNGWVYSGQCSSPRVDCCKREGTWWEVSAHWVFATMCKHNPVGLFVDAPWDAAYNGDGEHYQISVPTYDHDWSSGFHIGAKVGSCCRSWGFGVDFLWLDLDGDHSFGVASEYCGEFGWLNGSECEFPANSSITTKTETEYWLADAYWFGNCCLCQELLFRPFVGVRFGEIEFETTGAFAGGVVFRTAGSSMLAVDGLLDGISLKTKYEFVGLRTGLDVEYCICNPFFLRARLGATAAIADVDRTARIDLHYVAGPDYLYFTFDLSSECHGIIGLDTEVGLTYRWDICGWNVNVDLDYFAHAWQNVGELLDAPLGLTEKGVVIHGIKLGAGVTF